MEAIQSMTMVCVVTPQLHSLLTMITLGDIYQDLPPVLQEASMPLSGHSTCLSTHISQFMSLLCNAQRCPPPTYLLTLQVSLKHHLHADNRSSHYLIWPLLCRYCLSQTPLFPSFTTLSNGIIYVIVPKCRAIAKHAEWLGVDFQVCSPQRYQGFRGRKHCCSSIPMYPPCCNLDSLYMALQLAITIFLFPCGLYQVIQYSLAGLERLAQGYSQNFCLACLIWAYNSIGKTPTSHKSSKAPQVMLDFADVFSPCQCFLISYSNTTVLQWTKWH